MGKDDHHMCKSRQTKQLRTQAHNMIYFRRRPRNDHSLRAQQARQSIANNINMDVSAIWTELLTEDWYIVSYTESDNYGGVDGEIVCIDEPMKHNVNYADKHNILNKLKRITNRGLALTAIKSIDALLSRANNNKMKERRITLRFRELPLNADLIETSILINKKNHPLNEVR